MPNAEHDSSNADAAADNVLIQRIAAGDPRALEALYRRHGLSLLRYLTGQVADRAQAEEVLQDVMLAVWRSADDFRGESSVRTWLITIAHRRAINARTRRPPREYTPIDEADTISAESPSLIEVVIDQSAHSQIRAALDRLPIEQRETLELIFYHALSGPEAAQALGVAHGTIKSRLHRALATLRSVLKEAEITHER